MPAASSNTARPRKSVAARESLVKDSYIRARIDTSLKKAAEAQLDAMGLDASTVIRSLMVRIAIEGKLPFEMKVPNATSRRAMSDLRLGRGVTRVRGDAKSVLAALDADD